MKDLLIVLRFFAQMHARLTLGLVGMLTLWWCVFWFGGLWDIIRLAESGHVSIQMNIGLASLFCIYGVAAYIAFCFREANARSILLQLPVSRRALQLAPYLLAWLGSAILYALFEPAWRLGFLGFAVPSSFFLIFLPFLTIAAVLEFRKLWLALTLPPVLIALYYYAHFYRLSHWFFLQPQLPSEFVFLAGTLILGFAFAGKRFLPAAPIAAAVVGTMAIVTLSHTPRDYPQALELLSFYEQGRWVEALPRLAAEPAPWSEDGGLRYGAVENHFRALDFAERLLKPDDRSALLRNLVRNSKSYQAPDHWGDRTYWLATPISSHLISETDSAFLRESGAPEGLICELLPKLQSRENLSWALNSNSCAVSAINRFLPGSNTRESLLADELYRQLGSVKDFRKRHYLMEDFLFAQERAGKNSAEASRARRVSSEAEISEQAWEKWKSEAWKQRRSELQAFLAGDQERIRNKIQNLPSGTSQECEQSEKILGDLCSRLGATCSGAIRRHDDASLGRFLASLKASRRSCAAQLWARQTRLLEPANLNQLEQWGRQLAENPQLPQLSR